MTHAAAGVESTWQGVSHGGGDTLWAQEHAPRSQVRALAKERSCAHAMTIGRRATHQRLFLLIVRFSSSSLSRFAVPMQGRGAGARRWSGEHGCLEQVRELQESNDAHD